MSEGQAQLAALMELLRARRASLQASMTSEEWAGMYARALFLLGTYLTWPVSHYDERGWSLLTESLDIYRDLNQRENIATTLMFMGYSAQRIGNFAEAEALLTEGLAIYRELGDNWGAALVLQGLGMIALRSGDYELSSHWLTKSLADFTELADVRSMAASRATLGAVRLRQGDLAQASELLNESLRARLQIGDKGGIAWCLEWLAEAALATFPSPSGPFRAARLLGAASALRVALASPIDPVDLPEHERLLSIVQVELSDPAFVAAWEAGRAMKLEEVVAFALDPDGAATA
jgi:tetratricopeptide (TPR) repeat protein